MGLAPDRPPDFRDGHPDYIRIDSCYFKIGRFNWIFTWVNGRWLRSKHDMKSLRLWEKWPSGNVQILKRQWKNADVD